MRFGRKLALQVTSDQSGAPYLSHKAMKEAINKTVRDLRLYQGRLQCYENLKAGIPPAEGEATPSMEELLTLEEQIKDLDKELFGIVEEDLQKIFFHVRQSEAIIEPALSGLQEQALQCGLLLEESQLQRLQEILPFTLENPAEVCQKLIDMRLVQDIGAMSAAILDLAYGYNQFLDSMDEHTQYLEINVAGFRKLLKRHEKQVPHKFHATRTPCLGFHRLVTHTSRQLVDIATMLGLTIGDAIERMDAALASMHTAAAKAVQRNREQFPELRAPKGLGPESQMVLQIQAQLKEPSVQAMIPNSGPVDFLYPKPSPLQDRTAAQTVAGKKQSAPVEADPAGAQYVWQPEVRPAGYVVPGQSCPTWTHITLA